MTGRHLLAVCVLWFAAVSVALGQFTPPPSLVRSHPAIAYATAPLTDRVDALNRRLQQGEAQLAFDPATGYLPAVLAALNVSIDSQVLVFSKTSFQAPKISPQNPRALYFGDDVAVGWVRGGDVVEVISQDPRQGGIFYTLKQSSAAVPVFERNDAACVACHVSDATVNVPGMFVGSVFPSPTGMPMYGPAYMTDHRSPFDVRWGGWYVEGEHGATRHMGNAVAADAADLAAMVTNETVHTRSLEGRFDPASYLSRHSDIVALLVLEHQGRMANLITSLGWNVRLGKDSVRPIDQAAAELVDYMLFVDEDPLPGPITGPTAFAKTFSARGSEDSRHRSLRQFDLETRLFRYPCSYMIYSGAFDALPDAAKVEVYARLWEVLSGAETGPRYARLTRDVRQAIVEILRETKKDLPQYWLAAS